jgi:cytochrome b561
MNDRYTATAIALHWLMAALLVGLFALGLYMHDLPLTPWKLKLFSWHKWAGVTALLLVLVRLVWRSAHRPPELPAMMPRLMRLAAHTGHGMLYLLMIAIPLSGWLMSSAKGVQTVYFGVLPLPDLLDKNKELGDLLREVHEWLSYLLAAVVAGHVAAALKHHIVDKDGILLRMMPRRRSTSQGEPS